MTETSPATLHTFRREASSLSDAVAEIGDALGTNPVGLCYSPRRCFLVLCRQGRLETHDGVETKTALEDVFEARVFGDDGELRWWNDPSQAKGLGRAVFLTERDSQSPTGWEKSKPIPGLTVFRNQYLLWGQGWVYDPSSDSRTSADLRLPPDWSWLATGRIGRLAVPYAHLPDQAYLTLQTREYFRVDDDDAHGNSYVVDERWLGLALSPETTPGAPS